MVCWLSACTCCSAAAALLGGGSLLFCPLRAAAGLAGLLFSEIEARFQLRQPLLHAQAGGADADERKKGAANRCANHRDTHKNP
ncbi:hypothetical protein OVX87_13020 [Klebsiella pneumoniae]|nr:hypothetical protein [Klebsiella pneumoniae]